MRIDEILDILEKRLTNLNTLKNLAASTGDLENVVRIENQIKETEESIFILRKP